MKRFLSLLLLPFFAWQLAAAQVKISDLPLSTAPSTNTFLEIADMNAVTKSSKYLLTNLVTVPTQIALTHAGTVTLTNTALQSWATLTLTGSVTFATSALVAGHGYTVYGRNTQATNCTPTFPAWRFIGGAPATITAGKEWVLSLFSTGTVDTNVWAAYAEAQ